MVKTVYNTKEFNKLLRATKSKDLIKSQSATELIVNTFEPMVYKISYKINHRILGDKTTIEDQIQSGKLGLIEAIGTYNGTCSFSSWAYHQIRRRIQEQVANNCIIKPPRSELRRGIRYKTTGTEELENLTYEENVTENLDKIDNSKRITEALRLINRKYDTKSCSIFAEYYYLGTTIKELNKKYKKNCEYIIQKMLDGIRDAQDGSTVLLY